MHLAQSNTTVNLKPVEMNHLTKMIDLSFAKIAPFWPLKNMIAVNPLQGLEELAFEDALSMADVLFQQPELPTLMEQINRETIKWLQVYFDEGQATVNMPFRNQGLYNAWRQLAVHDINLHNKCPQKIQLLKNLSLNPKQTIAEYLLRIGLSKDDHLQFLTLLVTTLPGWSSYVKYRTAWTGNDECQKFPVSQEDYLAVRIVITSLLWQDCKKLIAWHKKCLKSDNNNQNWLHKIQKAEISYRKELLQKISKQSTSCVAAAKAQFVFCIDVRSEQFRRALESTSDYQTYGFAGFFGVPVQTTNQVTLETHSCCPVLISPKHKVQESPPSKQIYCKKIEHHAYLVKCKSLLQSMKYNIVTSFALVETLGVLSGIWMALRNLMPNVAYKINVKFLAAISPEDELEPCLDSITFKEQCSYAESALRMIGLTSNFASLVVFCGHGSATQNNAYASALDCGACGGNHGASNGRILAAILNRKEIRTYLKKHGINIPVHTQFLAALHNTTTDEVVVFGNHESTELKSIKENLDKARYINSLVRIQQLEKKSNYANAKMLTWYRAHDWAQVRPEWGLARNAAFIVAPRDITLNLDLEGRCFLHSYDYSQDPSGEMLRVILTAPMIVAQWINAQYLFSTIDNAAYGGGSKVTKNIIGKIAVMQGNCSDLMTGLPLQSVHKTDFEAYHEPQRLLTVVFAPKTVIDIIINSEAKLKNLFMNGWVQLACMQPEDRTIYLLDRGLKWQQTKLD